MSRESVASSCPLLAGLLALLVTGGTFAQCDYEFQVISHPGCPEDFSLKPRAINDSGVIVGRGALCGGITVKAFRWSAQDGVTFLNLGSGMTAGTALDVLDDGTIIGWGAASDVSVRSGFVWKDGVVQKISGPTPDIYVSASTALSDGTVVGDITDIDSSELFLWKNGVFLPQPESFQAASGMVGKASGNDWLSIARDAQAEAWCPIYAMQIPFPPLHFGPEPDAANRLGHALGTVNWLPRGPFTTYKRGYVWNGQSVQIIAPPPPYDTFESGDINDIGQVVGSAYCNQGESCGGAGLLWQNGTIVNLQQFYPKNEIGKLNKAWAINNHGQIAASGTMIGKGSLFLLTPHPPEGDVDIDCKVGPSDLHIVLDNCGPITNDSIARADLDGDGWVTGSDLALVLGNWSQ